MTSPALTPLDQQIGAALREARLTQGFTQDELAQALGINRTTIARYESGIRGLSIGALLQIAQVLDVALTTLLPGTATGPHEQAPRYLVPAERNAVAMLTRILEQHPEFVPKVLETVETLLRESGGEIV